MSILGAPQASGGPSGVTGGSYTCPACTWTGPAVNVPFHECAGPGRVEAYEDLNDDWEPCTHECDENCEPCVHEHCWICGTCGCPGYCDDYQTYNLRPEETGGQARGAQ
jgi:hypothetical protein